MGAAAMPSSIAKVFTNGNSQAIRLPKEFRLDTKEVFIIGGADGIFQFGNHSGTPIPHAFDLCQSVFKILVVDLEIHF